MRAALIHPPDKTGTLRYRRVTPLGLGYVAAAGRAAGHHVDIFDLGAEGDAILGRLGDLGLLSSYSVYGLSTYTETIRGALRLAEELKRRRPRARIVLGGWHASLADQQLLAEHPTIDFTIRGDGEVPFAELLDALAVGGADRDLAGIRSITWRSSRGAVTRNAAAVPADLDALPWPARDFRHGPAVVRLPVGVAGGARRVTTVVASRGCTNRCRFCAIEATRSPWRARGEDSVVAELAALHERSPLEHVWFQDPSWLVDPERAVRLACALQAIDPAITWSAAATVLDVLRAGARLRKLRALGCAYLELGVESGNAGSLRRFGKPTTVALNLKALEALALAGIRCVPDFINFEPEMTLAELRDNAAFVRRAGWNGTWPPGVLFDELKLYPKTRLRDDFERRLRTRWPVDELPDVPYTDPDVAVVRDAMAAYHDVAQRRADEVLDRFHGAAAAVLARRPRGRAVIAALQQGFARAVRIQHWPYRYFAELLEHPVGIEPRALAARAHAAERTLTALDAITYRLTAADDAIAATTEAR